MEIYVWIPVIQTKTDKEEIQTPLLHSKYRSYLWDLGQAGAHPIGIQSDEEEDPLWEALEDLSYNR